MIGRLYTLLLGRLIFRDYVSFREGKYTSPMDPLRYGGTPSFEDTTVQPSAGERFSLPDLRVDGSLPFQSTRCRRWSWKWMKRNLLGSEKPTIAANTQVPK